MSYAPTLFHKFQLHHALEPALPSIQRRHRILQDIRYDLRPHRGGEEQEVEGEGPGAGRGGSWEQDTRNPTKVRLHQLPLPSIASLAQRIHMHEAGTVHVICMT